MNKGPANAEKKWKECENARSNYVSPVIQSHISKQQESLKDYSLCDKDHIAEF